MNPEWMMSDSEREERMKKKMEDAKKKKRKRSKDSSNTEEEDEEPEEAVKQDHDEIQVSFSVDDTAPGMTFTTEEALRVGKMVRTLTHIYFRSLGEAIALHDTAR